MVHQMEYLNVFLFDICIAIYHCSYSDGGTEIDGTLRT